MSGPQHRINSFHKWALLISAVAMDFLQLFLTFIPFVGPFIASILGFLGRVTFWIWFKLLHVGFADRPNRFMINISITVLEFLPLLNMLPGWTIGTFAIIRQVAKEDQKHNKKNEEDSELQAANDNYKGRGARRAA